MHASEAARALKQLLGQLGIPSPNDLDPFAVGLGHDVSTIFFGICYGGVALTLALFFLFDGGCCHRSNQVEHIVVSLCLFGLYGCSIMMTQSFMEVDTVDKQPKDPQVDQVVRALLEAQSLMRLLLIIYVLRHGFLLGKHQRFYAGVRERQKVQVHLEGSCVSLRARRVAMDLDTVLQDIWVCESGSNQLIASGKLVSLLFVVIFFITDLLKVVNTSTLSTVLWCVSVFLQVVGLMDFVIYRLMRFWRRRPLCRQVNQFLRELTHACDANFVVHVLTSISVGDLVESARWEDICKFIDTALEDGILSTVCKAIMVDGLQKCGIRSRPGRQHMVGRIFLSCFGPELTELKNLIDSGGDYHNLYKLIYHDINDRSIRQQVLEHLRVQSAELRRELGGRVGLKVLSDIDDTVLCSGGQFPKGVDARFPRRIVYPGCLSLFKALDQASGDLQPGTASCNFVFLSARPHLYKDMAEGQSYNMLEQLLRSASLKSMPTLLPGKKRKGLAALMAFPCLKRSAWRPVGDRKHETYVKFRALYEEYDYLFLGDNGQGDLWSGQQMVGVAPASPTSARAGPETPEPCQASMLAVLIHDVLKEEKCLALENPEERGHEWRARLEEQHLFFFKTYVGAALALHRLYPDIVSGEQLRTVANEAISDFDELRLMYSERISRWQAAEGDLRQDLERVSDLLQDVGLDPLMRLKTSTEVCSLIRTPAQSRAHSVDITSQSRLSVSFSTSARASLLRSSRGSEEDTVQDLPTVGLFSWRPPRENRTDRTSSV
eukprot:TRINITY_DN32784_c0_g1_i1.p1 TRINITY_DN32784_c0_g1~~TRINITY_DN32784_c0_g1_i1.p1  ORF type:complete len:775 (+),score=184.35 TRINITY_DN32784_c0_g1_i1:122-2446(+)